MNDAILELGETGVFASIKEALNFESNTMRVLRDLALLSIVLRVGHWLWVKRHRRALEEYDPMCPPAYATPSVTKRLTPERFELQKMESTRLALEKLTASEEYKRHEVAKKESRKEAVSRTVLDDSVSEEENNGNDLGPATKNLNKTVAHEVEGLDESDESVDLSVLDRASKRSNKRRASGKNTPTANLGLVNHQNRRTNR